MRLSNEIREVTILYGTVPMSAPSDRCMHINDFIKCIIYKADVLRGCVAWRFINFLENKF